MPPWDCQCLARIAFQRLGAVDGGVSTWTFFFLAIIIPPLATLYEYCDASLILHIFFEVKPIENPSNLFVRPLSSTFGWNTARCALTIRYRITPYLWNIPARPVVKTLQSSKSSTKKSKERLYSQRHLHPLLAK